jgi:hypothetical protein
MNRPPLTSDNMDPSLQLFLLKLSVDTAIVPFDFHNFLVDNLDWLRPCFAVSAEPDTDPRVENVQAIWLRQQFKRRRVSA